ncbi:uncharacterized protein LOC108194662 [Daucus carota subsp. sativus]|uniref:uncharacterized protein LOC108194662 n=1 Tax=Daucus carota subsp. sativus TaxID=79200 RepID=UPI0007EEFB38|nr:PREDICTED: uncharacterized protein LOC108194662 [Daucus carota subsp. sativus]
MEKDWISKDRDSLEYKIGVEKFLIYAEQNCENPKKIPCPCSKCVNFKKFPVKKIRGHIYENGFSLGYIDWIWHRAKPIRSCGDSTLPPDEGEQNVDVFQYAFEAASDVLAAASEAAGVCEATYNNLSGNSGGGDYDKDSHEFKRFVVDAQQPLFEGSDYTKLDSVLKLQNWKARFGVSDSAFNDLLSTVGSLLPQNNVLPVNAYEAKKTLSNLGLEYVKFHACPNECVLYRGVHQYSSECPKCHLSRWKVGKDGKVRHKIPAKVSWYFPIIPRFKRMFKSHSTAELLTWHSKGGIQDGQMRHPADSPS